MKQYDVSEAMTGRPAIIEAAELLPMDANGEYRRLQYGETAGRERPEKDLWDAIQEFRDRHTPEQLAELDLAELYANIRRQSPDGR